MFRWLREFFTDPDPIVRVISGVSEPEALMWQELLENNGVPAMPKNISVLSTIREFGSYPQDFDLWVKRSDLERARGVLHDLVEPAHFVCYEEDDGMGDRLEQ